MEQKSTKLSYKKVISGVKLSLWIVWTWPMPKDTARFKIVCMKLYHCLCVILAIGLEVPIIYAIVNNIDDFSFFIDLILQQSPIIHAIFNFIFYNTNYHHIQNVVSNMEHFCNSMKSREEVVIQRYVDKCVTFYGVISVIFYVLSGIFCIVPLILHQPFPIVFEYPFDVYYQPLRVIIYAHQGIVAFIASGQLCLNAFAACLLWFASARFEMLIEDLKNFANIHQLTACVKKHQEILAYVAEVIIVARSFALTCICCSTINLIIIGVLFLFNQSLVLRFKYIFMVLACLGEVFMFAWPAEHLIFLSNNICQTLFDSDWYNQSLKIQKLLYIIIARSQKAVMLSIPCITPSISFNYLISYCSTILSYFTTLRVLLNIDKV